MHFFFRKSDVGGLSNLVKQMSNKKKHKTTTKKHVTEIIGRFYLSFFCIALSCVRLVLANGKYWKVLF